MALFIALVHTYRFSISFAVRRRLATRYSNEGVIVDPFPDYLSTARIKATEHTPSHKQSNMFGRFSFFTAFVIWATYIGYTVPQRGRQVIVILFL
jgi:hypothetical protein